MTPSQTLLSELIRFTKYSRHLPSKGRRETWEEIVDRNKGMHLRRFPGLASEIEEVYKLVYARRVIPSARSLHLAGKPIELAPSRIFNCSGIAIDSWEAFHEVMFLLLGGSGVSVSVQKHHVDQLPALQMPTKRKKRFLIGDSIEGWADAVKVLMKSYFLGTSAIDFDFADIRAKGLPLITSGGRAPGPQPLKDCLHDVQSILDSKERGDKLSTLECHDILCHISDAVLAGGIRRSAMLSLFSFDDEDMLASKSGTWYELDPQRARANNSACIQRHRIRQKRFFEFWERIKATGTGEPAFCLTNNIEYLVNPCSEVSLKASGGVCNLTTVNALACQDQTELNQAARAASFLGTLQSAYTNFHYLRDQWQENAEREPLLGVSLCGAASKRLLGLDLREAAGAVVAENQRVAKLLGIQPAARLTCEKPDGTLSLLLGTSAGVHAYYAPYYIRRIRLNKEEPLYKYLSRALPGLVEDEYFKPKLEAVLSIPMAAPQGAVLRSEGSIKLLERVKKLYQEWILPGHLHGDNTHSVSCTVEVPDGEWDRVGAWMWDNRAYYNSLTAIPAACKAYKQPPLEECTKEEFERLMALVRNIDLSKVVEEEDNTSLMGEAACAGGACQVA